MRGRLAVLAFLIFAACSSAGAQVGGLTALAPDPDQIGANQETNPAFATGTFSGYSYHATCATIGAAPVGGGNAVQVGGPCAGGSFRVFDVTLSLHNHEAILFRWQAYASPGTLTNNVNVGLFDNCHGNGSASVQQGRFQGNIAQPSSVFTTGFQEFYTNIAEHGSDSSCYDARFNVVSPGWPGMNKAEALNFEIVDANGNIEKITTAGTVGSSAPVWCTTSGCTTSDGTAGWTNQGANPPFYITNVEAEEEWFPLRTFLLYPNYRGYLWNDLTPPKRYMQIQPVSAGSPFYNFLGPGSSVAGEIMGVTTIDPPAADTLSQLTLTVKLATVPGCGSGVLATDTFSSPASVQGWQFTPSQYGSLTVGNAYYVCSSLYVTSGMTFIDSYPDYKIYYENATFRNAMFNWYDPNSVWYHNGSPLMLVGTYDRWSGSFRANSTAGQTTENGYVQGIGSLGPVNAAPQAINAPSYVRQNGSLVGDYCSNGFTGTLSSFGTFSAIDPLVGNDQLTPYLHAYADYCPNLNHWQIMNNVMGCLVTEQQDSTSSPYCTVAPTFTPTVTPGTGGSITANYLFLEAVGWSAPFTQGNSPPRAPNNTLPSAPLTVNLSAAGCAGVNCTATFTMPTCSTTRWLGWTLYSATGATSTPPANSAFQQQYPSSVTGMLGSGGYIPCGASVTLSSLVNGPAPPATDTTYIGRPFWVSSTTTDPQVWNDLFTGMNDATYKGAVGGMYLVDEGSYYSRRWLNEMDGQLYGNNLNLPVSCVLIGPGQIQMWRDECDLIGEDPYGIGFVSTATANNYATGEAAAQSCTVFNGNNTTKTITNCYPDTVDEYVDDAERATFGARPSWNVVQQFGQAIPYAVMKQQIWKAIIDCQVYGSLGCDAMTWGWVDSSGLEAQIFSNCSPPGQGVCHPLGNNTQAWFDSKRATNELKALMPVLLTPVEDSPLLGLGAVVSAASSSAGVHTECSVNQTSMYENTSMWPDAPAWFVTHTDPATGDQYIFANNLCSASAAFNETFTLANPPSGATQVEVLNEGRTLPIASNQFTDSWQDDDVHIYVIRAPRGSYIH